MKIFSIFRRPRIPLRVQIEDYIEWKISIHLSAHLHKRDLADFESFCIEKEKLSISDISERDIEEYMNCKCVMETPGTVLGMASCIKCFLRYCRSKKIPCVHESFIHVTHQDQLVFHYGIINKMTPKKAWIGRPPNVKKIEKIKRLKDVGGLTFREIKKLVGGDVKSVYRQYNYPIDKYKEIVGIR